MFTCVQSAKAKASFCISSTLHSNTWRPSCLSKCSSIRLQIREKEANVDNLINPIEDMYSLLMRYEVRVPKEETDMVGDLRYSWKKLRKLSTDVSDNLARLQVHLHHLLLGSLTFTLQHLLTAIICIQIALSMLASVVE